MFVALGEGANRGHPPVSGDPRRFKFPIYEMPDVPINTWHFQTGKYDQICMIDTFA